MSSTYQQTPPISDGQGAGPDTGPDTGPRRPLNLTFWRSPADQPGWSRPALLAVAAFAAVLFGWHAASSGYATYYAVAVHSMSTSWKALFYGAFDPGATMTMDKLAGSFVPQAISARIFGFSQWSLILPEVVEGIVAVLVLHRAVRRWAGPAPAILAAGIYALTPVVTSMYGHAMEDGALAMCLILAVDRYQYAVVEGRLRSLLMSGVWVGLGFQAKMLEAWLILPALVVGYLVSAPGPVRRRVTHTLLAGLVMAVVSVSWVTAMALTPTADRPYMDGTTNNNPYTMAFGYNGLSRFGINIPGAAGNPGGVGGAAVMSGQGSGQSGAYPGASGAGSATGAYTPPTGGASSYPTGGTASSTTGGAASSTTGGASSYPAGGSASSPATGGYPAAAGGSASSGAASSPPAGVNMTVGALPTDTYGGGKLFGETYASQIGWLYPLAVAGLAFGLFLWWRRRGGRTDVLGAGYLVWGVWLATGMAVLSDMIIWHVTYLASMAPPLAALAGAGAVELWRAARDGRTAPRVLVAVVIAAQVAWAVHLSSPFPHFLPWLTPLVIVLAVVAVAAVLFGRRLGRSAGRATAAGLVVAVAAMVATPSAWAVSVLDTRYGGTSLDAGAGPTSSSTDPAGPNIPVWAHYAFPEITDSTVPFGGVGFPDLIVPGGGLDPQESTVADYLKAHRDGAHYLFATDSWATGGPFILDGAGDVLMLGGFTGQITQFDPSGLTRLVDTGQVRYFLINGLAILGGYPVSADQTGPMGGVTTWVKAHCAPVPSADYESPATAATFGSPKLFACGAAATNG